MPVLLIAMTCIAAVSLAAMLAVFAILLLVARTEDGDES